MQGNYSVYIRAKDGQYVGRINNYANLKILKTLNESGSWSISSVTAGECPFYSGSGIVVGRNSKYLHSGIVTEISDTYNASTGLHSWDVKGKDDLEYLNRRICYVSPDTGRTDVVSHYTDSGDLATVVRNLINVNLGISAMNSRRETIIADSMQQPVGVNVSVSLRFQKLLDSVVSLAFGNGWNVRPVWDNQSKKIYYEVFQGRDLSGNIIFTEQLNNIAQAQHVSAVPEGNFVLAGGTGEMTARQFATAQNDDAIAEWGRIEVFQDARNQGQLDRYIIDVIDKKSSKVSGYSCTASNSEHTPLYGVDYSIGDFVGMKIFGKFITAEVQQCEIEVEDGIETFTPRFGTIALGKFRNIYTQIADLRSDVNELLGTEVE